MNNLNASILVQEASRRARAFANSWRVIAPLERGHLRLRDLPTHVGILGGTGAGKSSAVVRTLVATSSRGRVPVVAFAAKDSDAAFYQAAWEGHEPPIVFAPGGDFVFDWLGYLQGLGLYAAEITNVFMGAAATVNPNAAAGEAFWDNSTRNLLASVIEVLRAAKAPVTLGTIDRFVNELPQGPPDTRPPGPFVTHVLSTFTDGDGRLAKQGHPPALSAAFDHLLQAWPQQDARTASNILSSWQSVSGVLQQSPLKELLTTPAEGQKVLSPADVFDHGRSIIVDLPTLTTPLAGRVLQAIWLRCLLLGAARQTRRRQILVVADEFQSGAAIGTWREALATGREYGLGVALISQAIPNLAAAFGKEQTDGLLELIGTLVFCRNSCVQTNKYASEKSGTYRTNDQPGVPVPELRPEAFSRLKGPSKWRVDCETILVKDGRASPVVFRRSRRPAKRFGYRMRRAKWALITMMAAGIGALFTPQGQSVFNQTTAFITSLTEDSR